MASKPIKNPDKRKAWTECSRYVRIRECLETTGSPLAGVCITCNRQFHISALQAGHYYCGRSDSGNATLFTSKFIHLQCHFCNVIMHGQKDKYDKVMLSRHSEEHLEDWKWRLKRAKIADNQIDWEEKTLQFKRRADILMRRHGYKTWFELLQDGRS